MASAVPVVFIVVGWSSDHHAETVHLQFVIVLKIFHPGAFMEKIMDFSRHFRMIFKGGPLYAFFRPGIEHSFETGGVGRTGGIIQRMQITASVGADHN